MEVGKKIIFLLILTILSIGSYAQKFAWTGRLGGIGNDGGSSIAVDSLGNVYTTGAFEGIVDFDPDAGVYNLTSKGSEDIFISKLDSSGKFIWAKSVGGTLDDRPFSLAVDKSGNVYITGWFQGTADFDPDTGVYNLTTSAPISAFALKLNPSGKFIWAKSFSGTDGEAGTSITFDDSGNLLFGGDFGGTVDFDPGPGTYNMTSSFRSIFILKLDTAANFIWAKSMEGTSYMRLTSIKTDKYNNIFMTGYFDGTIDFDPDTGTYNLTSAGNYDIFISKLNSNGTFGWAKDIGGSGLDAGASMAIDSLENIYITGAFEGIVDFDPSAGIYNLTSAGGHEDFILKLDSSGNFIWAKRIGGIGDDFGSSIFIDAKGNIYNTGQFEGIVDFNSGSGIFNLSSNGLEDIFILKLDSSGNFMWVKQIGGSGYDWGISIIDPLLNIYTTGSFQGTADFDPSTGTYNLVSAGGYDIFVLKLCSPPSDAGSIIGPSSVCIGTTKNYSINSVTGATGYLWTVPAGATINSGQNTKTINVTFGISSGNITVTPTNACSNGVPDTMMVKVNPPPTIGYTVLPSSTVCAGSSVTLGGTGASTYTWSGGINNGVSFVPSSTNTYAVIGTDSNGCTNTDTVTITVIPYPQKIVQRIIRVCEGANATLSAENTGMQYKWNEGDTTQKINTTKAGIHVVKISNGQCFINDTVTVIHYITPKPIISVNNNVLESTHAKTYQWYNLGSSINNATQQQFTPKQNGYYFVHITDSNDCEAQSDSILFIKQFDEIKIYPNPTHQLLTIELPNKQNQSYTLELYDVLGQQLQIHYEIKDGITEIDLNNYAATSYYFRISDSKGNQCVRKVVKW